MKRFELLEGHGVVETDEVQQKRAKSKQIAKELQRSNSVTDKEIRSEMIAELSEKYNLSPPPEDVDKQLALHRAQLAAHEEEQERLRFINHQRRFFK